MEPRSHFERVVILFNPNSTNAGRGRKRIAELQKTFGYDKVQVIETIKGGPEANRKLLKEHIGLLGPHCLLGIAGGDGTVNMVIEFLVQSDDLSDHVRETPILPLWSGNANDLAHMLNGAGQPKRLQKVLQQGEVVAVHPLSSTLSFPDGTEVTRIAACYASFGATAFAAAKLNEPFARHNILHRLPFGRTIHQIATSFSALMEAPRFAVEEQGEQKIIYERTFANGSRFAKIDRIPLKLTEGSFILQTLEEKHLLRIAPNLYSMMRKNLRERFLRDQAQFTITVATRAQFDGESIDIPAGTQVKVTLSERPFYALSLLLIK